MSVPASTVISLIDGAAQQSSSACCRHVVYRDSPSPEMLFTTAPLTPPRTLDNNWPTAGPHRRCNPPPPVHLSGTCAASCYPTTRAGRLTCLPRALQSSSTLEAGGRSVDKETRIYLLCASGLVLMPD